MIFMMEMYQVSVWVWGPYTNEPTPPVIHPTQGAHAPLEHRLSTIGTIIMTSTTTNSIVGSASNATVSIFDMVGNTANQATKLIGTVGTSIDMLDTFVGDARKRQLARSKLSMREFYKELHEDTSLAIANRQREIQSKLQADPALTKLYEENFRELETIIQSLQSE